MDCTHIVRGNLASPSSPNSMADETSRLLSAAVDKYVMAFGRRAAAAARAPGRVNLIGDHVDYCDGLVLPMALQFSTVVVGGYNGTSHCNIVSLSEGTVLEANFPRNSPLTPLRPGEPSWANYVKGVLVNFPEKVEGFDAVITSNVPLGGGVSSSAALEVAFFTFLEALTGIKVDIKQKALACQRAEHEYAGMPCGIMDQYIAAMGKKDHALLIDCRSLEATHIPLLGEEIVILITNSNVKHQLTGSEYPLRRQQCHMAAKLLAKKSLRDATEEDLEELKRIKADVDVLKRARHVVTEIGRTQRAAELLKRGDFKSVGELFFESHESLSKLMETSCPELDQLVEISRSVPGVVGSRVTGGGFGGCTVTLVNRNSVEQLKGAIRSRYKGSPDFYVCEASDGAQILPL